MLDLFSEEFDIIPAMKPENESCPFLLHENKLGIYSWCVKDLFCHVYGQLTEKRRWQCVKRDDEGEELSSIKKVSLVQVSSCSNTGSITDGPYWTSRKNS